MLTRLYIEALLVDPALADAVWEGWKSGFKLLAGYFGMLAIVVIIAKLFA